MTFTWPFEYVEETIPPRCHKPRPVTFSSTVEVTVPEVSANDAPVALLVRPWDKWVDFLHYRGRFFVRAPSYDWQHQKSLPQQFDVNVSPFCGGRHYYMPHDEARQEVIHHFGRFLVVDGLPYQAIGEPRWVYQTFGLGHNHGGTGLFVDVSYNPNVPNSHYFRLDKAEDAVAAATATALRRGDDHSIERIRAEVNRVRILMPEVLTLDPMNEHGEGDPFLNRLHRISEMSESANEAGVLVLIQTMAEIADSDNPEGSKLRLAGHVAAER